jgi:hypothetical protein
MVPSADSSAYTSGSKRGTAIVRDIAAAVGAQVRSRSVFGLIAGIGVALAAAPSSGEPLSLASPVGVQAVGPVRIGMTPEEASKAAGVALTGDPFELYEDGSCYYVMAEGELDAFGFMVSEGKIARIEITDTTEIATVEGARIGDSEKRILELYPDATIAEHAYEGPEGHYVKTSDADGTYGYVFETDGTKVTRYRAGKYPEVDFYEGCL